MNIHLPRCCGACLQVAPAKSRKPSAVLADITASASAAPTAKGKKEKTVEQIYQKKTQLEHILLRPDSYSE